MKQKIILIAIVGGVVVLFAVGIFNREKTTAWIRHFYYRGRSQVANATDVHQPVNSPEAAEQCRANLRRIENAKRKVAQDQGRTFGRLADKDILVEMPGRALPKCPAGGEYIIGDINMMPKCTIGSNNTVRPEDDHIVINY